MEGGGLSRASSLLRDIVSHQGGLTMECSAEMGKLGWNFEGWGDISVGPLKGKLGKLRDRVGPKPPFFGINLTETVCSAQHRTRSKGGSSSDCLCVNKQP